MFQNYYDSLYETLNKYEYLVMFVFMFSVAALSRGIFQGVPSVEPLLAIIYIAGRKYGVKYGATFGAFTYYTSNFFVYGGQGWWTVPMMIGAALTGIAGGVFKKRYMIGMFVGVVLYELVINSVYALLFGLHTLMFAVPFIIVHIVSSLGFIKAFHVSKKLRPIMEEMVRQ